MHRLFHALPYGAKVAATSLVARRKQRQKYGEDFRRHFAFLMGSSVAQQEERAGEELAAFLRWVRETSDFYAVPSSLDLREMPVLCKAEVRTDYGRIATGQPFRVVRSSGTTGQPLAVPYSRDAYQREYAFWWYHRSFGGVRQGDRIATFAGHKVAAVERTEPPFWVRNLAENQLLFSSYHLAQRNLPHYVRELNRFRPDFIHGYPSSIYLVARQILDSGARLDFQPKMIATASETTLDFQRQAIEAAFGCKLYVWYGNTEFCGHITECSRGRLHVQPYHSRVRLLRPDGREAGPGEEGTIVATCFANRAFPLINYDTGDTVRVSADQGCGCGKGGLTVDFIIGRVEDYIVTPNGRFVGRLDHLFKDARHVRNAQLEQRHRDELIIRVEREAGYDAAEERVIFAEARSRLGEAMAIRFDYVPEIGKDRNGKFRFIIQNLDLKVGMNP
jgi:phenylacetate-CoA ligase